MSCCPPAPLAADPELDRLVVRPGEARVAVEEEARPSCPARTRSRPFRSGRRPSARGRAFPTTSRRSRSGASRCRRRAGRARRGRRGRTPGARGRGRRPSAPLERAAAEGDGEAIGASWIDGTVPLPPEPCLLDPGRAVPRPGPVGRHAHAGPLDVLPEHSRVRVPPLACRRPRLAGGSPMALSIRNPETERLAAALSSARRRDEDRRGDEGAS